jgi:FkbM family methyltransferase
MLLRRLLRKFADFRRYTALSHRREDRRDLRALGLWRNRLISLPTASRLTRSQSLVIAPRLSITGGEPVRITLGDYGEMDCFDELFIDRIYQLADVPFTPDLVVDCGAFHGYFCALARGKFPATRIVCFEPNPGHQAALCAQIRLLSTPVEIQAAAVGTTGGTALFSGQGMGGALISSPSLSPDSVEVIVVDFPRWLKSQSARALVWKLDVEGAEMDLLPSTLPFLPQSTALYLETHYEIHRCGELLAPYAEAGFSIREVRRRNMDARTYVEWFLLRTGTP